MDKVCSKFLEVWKHFLERKEEDQRVQQVEQGLVSCCPTVLLVLNVLWQPVESGRIEGQAELEVGNSATRV